MHGRPSHRVDGRPSRGPASTARRCAAGSPRYRPRSSTRASLQIFQHELVHQAHAAVDLQCLVGDPRKHLGGRELGHRDRGVHGRSAGRPASTSHAARQVSRSPTPARRSIGELERHPGWADGRRTGDSGRVPTARSSARRARPRRVAATCSRVVPSQVVPPEAASVRRAPPSRAPGSRASTECRNGRTLCSRAARWPAGVDVDQKAVISARAARQQRSPAPGGGEQDHSRTRRRADMLVLITQSAPCGPRGCACPAQVEPASGSVIARHSVRSPATTGNSSPAGRLAGQRVRDGRATASICSA